MIDILTLALTHGLMAITLWRLLARDDLGQDPGEAPAPPPPWLRARATAPDEDA